MSRTRRALHGFITDFGSQIVLTLANFALAPLILKLTSPIQYGFWLTALSILSYVGLVDIGLGLALTQAIAVRSASGDEALNRVISTGFLAFCCAGLILAGIALPIAGFIPRWFSIPQGDALPVIQAYRVAVLASALALPCGVYSGVVNGFQRLATDNLVRSSVTLASLVLTVVLLWLGCGLLALALSTLFSVVVSAILAAYWAKRYFPKLRISLSLANWKDFRGLIGFGGYFQLGRIANTVALNSDSVIISGALGAGAVTPYVFTSKIANLLSFTLASKLPAAVFPAMAQMYAANEHDRMRIALLRLAGYSTRLAVIGATVCALCNHQFVSLWVGENQYGGRTLTAVFCYWVLQDTINRGTASALYATGKLKWWAFSSLAEAMLNLGFSLLLVRNFGLVGVALGTSIGKTFTMAWLIPWQVCRTLRLPIRQYLLQGIATPALLSLPSVAAASGAALLIPETLGWVRLFGIGMLAMLANALLFEGLEFARAPKASVATFRALFKPGL